MINDFKDDFFWMLKENKGYFPWIDGDVYKLFEHLCFFQNEEFFYHYKFSFRKLLWLMIFANDYRSQLLDFLTGTRKRHKKFPFHYEHSPRALICFMIYNNVCENPLFDYLMKALIRAELRFISRFIPQLSHEERLTGNLVSEIDNSIFLIKSEFEKMSILLYLSKKEIDFLYYDLSKGGKLEKETGADLALMLAVDLPDFPLTYKTLILQAKKIKGDSVNIDNIQYSTLKKNWPCESAYLFYDMNLNRMCSPIVVPTTSQSMNKRYDESNKSNNHSFTLTFNEIKDEGYPLSLFVISHFLFVDSIGETHNTFKNAFQSVMNINRNYNDTNFNFNGRLAILSLGKGIEPRIFYEFGMEKDV